MQAIRHPRGTLSAGSGLFLLREAGAAMTMFARCVLPPALIARGFALYEQFRRAVSAGVRGWGAKGTLSIRKIAALAE